MEEYLDVAKEQVLSSYKIKSILWVNLTLTLIIVYPYKLQIPWSLIQLLVYKLHFYFHIFFTYASASFL